MLNEDDVVMLLDYGYLPDEIEEMLYDEELLNEAIYEAHCAEGLEDVSCEVS